MVLVCFIFGVFLVCFLDVCGGKPLANNCHKWTNMDKRHLWTVVSVFCGWVPPDLELSLVAKTEVVGLVILHIPSSYEKHCPLPSILVKVAQL